MSRTEDERMNDSRGRLRFKSGTSFAVALFGAIAFVRLLSLEPVTAATAIQFLSPLALAVAGLWRGLIYWQALRSSTAQG